MLLLVLIILPLLAAAASLFVKKQRGYFEIFTVAASSIEFVAGLFIASKVVTNGSYSFEPYFTVDALSTIVMLTTVVIGLAAAVYSVGYLRVEEEKQIINFSQIKQYYFLFNIFIAVMYLAVATVNPIFTWIMVEATTLSTAFLIRFYNKASAIEAAWKFLILNSIGLLLGFFGSMLFFTSVTGEGIHKFISWQVLLDNAVHLDPLVAKIAFIFVIVGYGTKAGFVPMHTWKPDAYGKAPFPIAALFSGPLLNVAMLTIMRYKTIVDVAIGHAFAQNLLIFFGIISIVVAASIVLVQKNFKRLFAYSSIEHVGIMALGFGFSGVGSVFALMHMIYHSLTKTILFFSAGNLMLKFGSAKIENIKGAIKLLPVTSVALLVGFLGITGVPPFGIFITEFNILSAGIGNFWYIVVLALVAFVLVFIGFFNRIVGAVFGQTPETLVKGENNLFTVLPIVALIVMLAVGSFYLPQSIWSLIHSAAAVIN